MRKIYSKSIILGVLLLLTPWLLALAPYQLTPNSHMVKITMSITEVIRKLHYRQVPLDDALSAKILKRYQNLRKRVNQFNAEDVFQLFINAYTLSLEPHTSYMSPSSSENFDISMRLSLEGIGAVLRASNDYT
ncbi:hypothetical protein TI05_18745, partial [Achromatium sp. WMS3]